MRLRQLGHGQSFKYFAPPEVDQQIRALIPGHTPTTSVAAADVLRWVIVQTCAELLHNIPHWVKQGLEYADRRQAWEALTLSPLSDNVDIAKHWLRPDAKTLPELYQPWSSSTEDDTLDNKRTRERASALLAQSRLAGLAGPISSTASIEEEQEREVDVEVEQERQVERPPKARPAEHHVHNDVRSLIRYGHLSEDTTAFAVTYAALASVTSSPTERSAWTRDLVATRDFLNTVTGVSNLESSQYLRPVNWIVSLVGSRSQGHRKVLVLLSPFEVNELLPEIRRGKNVQLHVYAPKVVQSRVSFDDLRFHTIPHSEISLSPPPDVVMQLNLMAGQLYLPNSEVYAILLDFLGVVNRTTIAAEDLPEVQGDGFIAPQHRTGQMLRLCQFKESPLPFIGEILGLRRKGASYHPTHLGKVLSVSPLTADDFRDGTS